MSKDHSNSRHHNNTIFLCIYAPNELVLHAITILHLQGAPKKTIPLKKFIISVTVIDFVTKFTVLQRRLQAMHAANFITIFGFI